MKVAVIVTTAGQGTRMGTGKPKQYLNIAGKPIIAHTLDRFANLQGINDLVVVVPPSDVNSFSRDIIEQFNFPRHWKVIAGGAIRQESVMNGLNALPNDVDVVVVHDGVRPFITKEIIENSINMAIQYGGCVVAMPLKETIKKVGDGRTVSGTVDRSTLWGAQTPQTFHYPLLRRAYEAAARDNFVGTDEAMLVERLGNEVKVVEGDCRNIKITTPEDLIIAEAIASSWGS